MYTIHLGNTIFCSGGKEMFIPDGGAHVRQCYVRIPIGFIDWPTITISNYNFNKNNPQSVLGGWGKK